MKAAPRLDPRLVRALHELDDPSKPIAETCRRLGDLATALDLARPSYENVRRLTKAHRSQPPQPTLTDVALDVIFQVRPPVALVKAIAERAAEQR